MSANWSVLNPSEMRELHALAVRWQDARKRRDYAEADRLRAELVEWGAFPPERGWHPVFESRHHRAARIRARGE